MNRPRVQRWSMIALGALAAAQLVALGYRETRIPASGARRIGVGDDVSDIIATNSDGTSVSLAGGNVTLLMVFHSECPHCARVAPTWTDWLHRHEGEIRSLAVSNERFEAARAYADAHAWGIPVRTVSAMPRGGPGHSLTSRTPWLFVIDADGRVLAEGHGQEINEVVRPFLDSESAALTSETK